MNNKLNKATGIVICILLFTISVLPLHADTKSALPETGPTLMLDYGLGKLNANAAVDLMYFVPLISLTLVDSEMSPVNTQTVVVLSGKVKRNGNSFKASYEFQMKGKGFHRNNYEPNSMIKTYSKIRKQKTLKNMLEYIILEGQGYGRIDVTGKTENGKEIINEVIVHFNARGGKSPVRIGIYTVKSVKGKFDYEKRYGKMIVRVNTLSFKKTDSEKYPKMRVSVGSLVKANEREGFWGNLKGTIANLFIAPIEIDPSGNNAMLDFGRMLYNRQDSYTFPKAKNLIIKKDEVPLTEPK